MPSSRRTIRVVDSHTAGEPTRVVIEGGPDLGRGSLAERRERFRREFDHFRSAIVNEPRGSDPVVGALLVPPSDSGVAAGVIFFNNVGYLGMCGHGTIGVIATLAYLGRIAPGKHRIETPVGTVTAELHAPGGARSGAQSAPFSGPPFSGSEVSVENVPSYRLMKNAAVETRFGRFTGDVAWGGNWFFLVHEHEEDLDLAHVDRLTEVAWAIREALAADGITGAEGAEIDHVELFGPARGDDGDNRNFVLCPGKAYDRSPCGTGTSAKLACLYADGKLKEGDVWRQESIVGSLFSGTVKVVDGKIIPTIRGSAYVNAEATLILDERDPFCWGIRADAVASSR